METLTIHTEDAEKMQTVKAVLKALDVQFEPKLDAIPPQVLDGIKAGLAQYKKDGKSISFDEFKQRHFSKK